MKDYTNWGSEQLSANQIEALSVPSPCDECQNRQHCAIKKLACTDYHRFVVQGVLINKLREPSAIVYRIIFKGEKSVEEHEIQKQKTEAAQVQGLLELV